MNQKGVSTFFTSFVILLLAAIAVIAIFMVIQEKGIGQTSQGQIVIAPEEIGLSPGGEIIESGTFSDLEEGQLRNLLSGFIDEYSKIEEIEKLYFISGDVEKITVMEYEMYSDNETSSGLRLIKGEVKSRTLTEEEKNIEQGIVRIEGFETTASLKSGEKFFFVVIQTAEGEKTFYS